MHKFLELSLEDRRVVLTEAAERLGLSPLIVEKDLWVCWTLQQLFKQADLADALIFKGGTSLSKAYHIIERFSEDIDLTINREGLGIKEEHDPGAPDIPNKERRRRLENLADIAKRAVQEDLMPKVSGIIGALLPVGTWKLEIDTKDAQCLVFSYPRVLEYKTISSKGEEAPTYIQPRIKLEFGARGGTEPNEKKTVSPYVIEEAPPELFGSFETPINTLVAERTFWEKITLLHQLHAGGNDKSIKERMSRHYYDTAMMEDHPVAKAAIAQPELLQAVVENKRLYFGYGSAIAKTAKMGSLKILPPSERLSELRADHQAMKEMFIGDVPSIEKILEGLANLDELINKKGN